MKDKQVKTEYNYLVLTDFSEASYIALKYAISLAKLIKGNIHVCHIANPSKIVQNDNQVAAIREINLETQKIEKKIGAIVEMILTEGINAIPYCSIGNIIYEFEELANQLKPDVVILGKKAGNRKLSGKITSYLMNEYLGSLLIIDKESEFQTDTNISIACNENTLNQNDSYLISSLDRQTKTSISFLNIKSSKDKSEKISVPQTWWKSNNEADRNIEIKYENDSTIASGLNKYISSNNINLLCIGKGKQRNFLQRLISRHSSTVLDIVNKVHIPILVMGANPK
tara:strand:+ start:202 stop:1053 length:852 start_codon:yes stop_codon:yes gene_type:complete